jgi:hypothetical protein
VLEVGEDVVRTRSQRISSSFPSVEKWREACYTLVAICSGHLRKGAHGISPYSRSKVAYWPAWMARQSACLSAPPPVQRPPFSTLDGNNSQNYYTFIISKLNIKISNVNQSASKDWPVYARIILPIIIYWGRNEQLLKVSWEFSSSFWRPSHETNFE